MRQDSPHECFRIIDPAKAIEVRSFPAREQVAQDEEGSPKPEWAHEACKLRELQIPRCARDDNGALGMTVGRPV